MRRDRVDRPGAGLALPAPGRLRGQIATGDTCMSLWSRAPRQVYMVHGEDDPVAEDDLTPSERMAPALDASTEGSRSGRVLGLALLVVVALGAVGLVLLSLSHAPAGRQSTVGGELAPRATRPAFPGLPTTARPEIQAPARTKRHARASIPPQVRPRRHYRRIARGHSEFPKIATAPAGHRPSGGSASAGGEFDFER
jgi:hypothetical protein